VNARARRAKVGSRWLRWFIALATLLASLAVPACSQRSSARAPAPRPGASSRPQAGPRRAKPAKANVTPEGGVPVPAAAQPPPGPPRRHPFAPTSDPMAREALSMAGLGDLMLKGIIGGPTPTAIIAEGGRVHYLAVGESLGTLTVLEIREDEVVLVAGRQKRVLTLYEPPGQMR